MTAPETHAKNDKAHDGRRARLWRTVRRSRRVSRATILLSSGLVANLATQMTFAATLPEIAVAWSLDASESGWIGGIHFAGYAIAVPFLASATDRMDGRRLYVGSALLAAAATLAFAAFAQGFGLALIFAFLAASPSPVSICPASTC